MSIHDNTKYAFADAIKQLLITKDLRKVRVKELCDLCGTERPTFYYHFKDKYELISWIYEQDFKHATEKAEGRYNIIQLEHLLITMRKEQIFYQKAFADVSQNNLYRHIYETNVKLFAKIIKEQFLLRELCILSGAFLLYGNSNGISFKGTKVCFSHSRISTNSDSTTFVPKCGQIVKQYSPLCPLHIICT